MLPPAHKKILLVVAVTACCAGAIAKPPLSLQMMLPPADCCFCYFFHKKILFVIAVNARCIGAIAKPPLSLKMMLPPADCCLYMKQVLFSATVAIIAHCAVAIANANQRQRVTVTKSHTDNGIGRGQAGQCRHELRIRRKESLLRLYQTTGPKGCFRNGGSSDGCGGLFCNHSMARSTMRQAQNTITAFPHKASSTYIKCP